MDFVAGLCPNDGWGKDFPLTIVNAEGVIDHCAITKPWRAIRQRWPICGKSTAWPFSSESLARGLLDSISDNGDGTLRLHVSDNGDWSSRLGWPADAHPSSYTVGFFPRDYPDASGLGDLAYGFAFNVVGFGNDYWPGPPTAGHIDITNDGKLLLNIDSLSAFTDSFKFEVVRGGPVNNIGSGFSCVHRFPWRNNSNEYDCGTIVTRSSTATAGSDTTHIVDSALDADPKFLSADYYVGWSVTDAGGHYAEITAQTPPSGGSHATFTLSAALPGFTSGSGYTLKAATKTSIIAPDPNDASVWKGIKNWPADLKDSTGKWREFCGDCGAAGSAYWQRVLITAADVTPGGHPRLTFGSSDVRGIAIAHPPKNYWVVDAGGWWRPEFRLLMNRVVGRDPQYLSVYYSADPAASSDFYYWSPSTQTQPPLGAPTAPWFINTNAPWSGQGGMYWRPLSTWSSYYTDSFGTYHGPDDDMADNAAPIYVDAVTFTGAPIGTYSPPHIVTVFDVPDANDFTDPPNTVVEVRTLNPYSYLTPRGLQLAVDGPSGLLNSANWVEKKDYTGAKSIPILTRAKHGLIFAPSNAQTVTVTGIVGGGTDGDAIVSISMPGATSYDTWSTRSNCYFELQASDGSTRAFGTGTATATTFHADSYNFRNHPAPPSGDGEVDIGLKLIVFFGRSRRYPRRVRYIYKQIHFVCDTDDFGAPVFPPTSAKPGYCVVKNASTHYATYDDHGALSDSGPAFIDQEAAIYVADNEYDGGWDADAWEDVTYQGIPALPSQSAMPRFEGSSLAGTVESAGTFTGGGYIIDSTQTWELNDTGGNHYTGTGDAASNTTTIHCALWSDDGGATTFNPAVDGRFTSASGPRFELSLPIIWASNDAGVTWVPRPASSYNAATQKFTCPAFPFSTNGKKIKFAEAGARAGGGSLLHPFLQKQLVITAADGSSAVLPITANDLTCLAYGGDAGFTVDSTCTYFVRWIKPGSVLHRRAGGTENVNGWVMPENALPTPDGVAWHTGTKGPLENAPTIVHDFGFFCCGDISTSFFLWNEIYLSIDSLRWIKRDAAFSSRSPANFLSGTPELNYRLVGDDFTADDPSSHVPIMDARWADTVAHPPIEHDGDVPRATWEWFGSGAGPWTLTRCYAYPIFTAATTELKSSATAYVKADLFPDFDPPTDSSGGPYPNWTHWDSNGDGLAISEWKAVCEFPADNTLDRRGATPFGDPSLPQPNDPTISLDPPDSDQRGYIVTDQCVIEKFDVAGGLTFAS